MTIAARLKRNLLKAEATDIDEFAGIVVRKIGRIHNEAYQNGLEWDGKKFVKRS